MNCCLAAAFGTTAATAATKVRAIVVNCIVECVKRRWFFLFEERLENLVGKRKTD